MGVTGRWLRSLLRTSLEENQTLWPLGGVFLGILAVMIIMAAVAVAKEEQYNFLTVRFKNVFLYIYNTIQSYIFFINTYTNCYY